VLSMQKCFHKPLHHFLIIAVMKRQRVGVGIPHMRQALASSYCYWLQFLCQRKLLLASGVGIFVSKWKLRTIPLLTPYSRFRKYHCLVSDGFEAGTRRMSVCAVLSQIVLCFGLQIEDALLMAAPGVIRPRSTTAMVT
jgi:hypothetical protein